MTLKKQIFSVLATGAVLLHAAIPAFADTTLVVSGNGADSSNHVDVNMQQSQAVVQSNNADITNHVNATADTGDNKASKNTGGAVSIDTGDASTDVTVQNSVNSNTAQVDCCGSQNVDVLVSGNGADSHNNVDLDINKSRHSDDPTTLVTQSNNADIDNRVYAKSDSGDNKANENTGGDVSIYTGDADSKVKIENSANANWAKVGSHGDENGSVSLRILDNGADSRNRIDLDLKNTTAVVQDNNADVDNHVDAKADTGDNKANENTSGDVSIDTGDASVDVSVDNMVNFNWADVDCGCLFDLLAKVAGNGADSHNKIEADLKGDLEVFQDNCGDKSDEIKTESRRHHRDCGVDNNLDGHADTGDNKTNENGGGSHGGDPSIETGDADSTVHVDTAGNSNVYGDPAGWEWPDLGGANVNVTLDLNALLALLGL